MIKKQPEYPIRYSGCLKKHKDGDVAGITSTAPRQPKQSSPALAKCRHSRESQRIVQPQGIKMQYRYKNVKPLICQDCQRNLGEATGADYQSIMRCRRCKKLNTFKS